VDEIIKQIATKDSLWAAINILAVVWFMRAIVIPMKDRHFQTMDVVESAVKSGVVNYGTVIARVDAIDRTLVELRENKCRAPQGQAA
jgi:hypothetical protein